jgi:NNP family nitrate/nitrite transporter-like MFS transporter
MEADLGLRHVQSGAFVLLTGIGFFFSQFSAAFLAGWRGYRFCILLSLWGTAAATALTATLKSTAALYMVFLGLGITGGIYVPAGIALITVLVRPGDWGKAIGIHELAPNLALITVPFLATAAVAAGSWRGAYLVVTGGLALLGVVHAVWGIDAPEPPSPPDANRLKSIASRPSFWVVALLLSLAVGLETGVYAMVPLFLVNARAYDLAAANHLLGLSRIPSLAVVLIAGWITDRMGVRKTISIGLGISGIAILAMAGGPDAFIAPAIFLQAAAAAFLFPPILAACSGNVSAQDRALFLSLSLAVAPAVGSGLLPVAIAWAGDMGSFAGGMIFTGIVTIAGIGLVPLLGER